MPSINELLYQLQNAFIQERIYIKDSILQYKV